MHAGDQLVVHAVLKQTTDDSARNHMRVHNVRLAVSENPAHAKQVREKLRRRRARYGMNRHALTLQQATERALSHSGQRHTHSQPRLRAGKINCRIHDAVAKSVEMRDEMDDPQGAPAQFRLPRTSAKPL